MTEPRVVFVDLASPVPAVLYASGRHRRVTREYARKVAGELMRQREDTP